MESKTPTHGEYPHLSEEEWSTVCRLSNEIGSAATLQILKMESKAQKSLLAKLMIPGFKMNPMSSYDDKIKIDTTFYSGMEGQNLLQWFTEVQMAMVASRVTRPDMQVCFAISRLKGRAKSWALNKVMSNAKCFPDWETLKGELTFTFEPPRSEFRARTKFVQIQQGKKSLYEYIQLARSLVASITINPIVEDTKVSVFLNGLRDGRIRDHLFRVFPDTMEKAISIAQEEEFSMIYSKRSNINVDNRHNNGNRREQNVPTPMDLSFVNVARKSQNSSNFKNRGYKNIQKKNKIKCFRCNREGHISRDCRVQIPGMNSHPKNKDGRGPSRARPSNGQVH